MTEIVDAQIHAPHHALQVFREDPDAQGSRDKILIASALAAMDAVGVSAAVVHDVPDVCDAFLRAAPRRFAAIVRLDPELPDAPMVIGRIRRQPGVLGIRLLANPQLRPEHARKFREGGFEPWLAAAQKHEVPICMYAAAEPEIFHRVATQYPDLRIVVDHFGLSHPPYVKGGPEAWEPLGRILDLAAYPNVAIKFSGAPSLSAEPYPFRDIWPHLRRVIDAFGLDRLMWGSDYTRVRREHSYMEAVGYLRETGWLSEGDREKLFGATLRRVLGWPQAGASEVPAPA